MRRYVYPAVSPAPAEMGYGEQDPSQAASHLPDGRYVGNGAVHDESVAAGTPVAYNGNGYDGNAYNGNGYNGNEYNGDGYNGNGYNGNEYSGNGYNGDGYNGNGYNGNGYSEVSYNGNGSVISINGNGSTVSGYGNGTTANGSSYSSNEHHRNDSDLRFVRRRLLPMIPTGGKT